MRGSSLRSPDRVVRVATAVGCAFHAREGAPATRTRRRRREPRRVERISQARAGGGEDGAAREPRRAELEAAKRAREAAETELRGSQVQASIAAATIQALEATTSHLQEEIAKVGSDLEELKVKNLENRSKLRSPSVALI